MSVSFSKKPLVACLMVGVNFVRSDPITAAIGSVNTKCGDEQLFQEQPPNMKTDKHEALEDADHYQNADLKQNEIEVISAEWTNEKKVLEKLKVCYDTMSESFSVNPILKKVAKINALLEAGKEKTGFNAFVDRLAQLKTADAFNKEESAEADFELAKIQADGLTGTVGDSVAAKLAEVYANAKTVSTDYTDGWKGLQKKVGEILHDSFKSAGLHVRLAPLVQAVQARSDQGDRALQNIRKRCKQTHASFLGLTRNEKTVLNVEANGPKTAKIKELFAPATNTGVWTETLPGAPIQMPGAQTVETWAALHEYVHTTQNGAILVENKVCGTD